MIQEVQYFLINGDTVEALQWDGSRDSIEFIRECSDNRIKYVVDDTSKEVKGVCVPVNGQYESVDRGDYLLRRVKDSSMFVMDKLAFDRFKEVFDLVLDVE